MRVKQEWKVCPVWPEPKVLVPFTEMGMSGVREGVCATRLLSGDVE